MGMEGNRNSVLGIIWELEYVIKLGMDKRGNENVKNHSAYHLLIPYFKTVG